MKKRLIPFCLLPLLPFLSLQGEVPFSIENSDLADLQDWEEADFANNSSFEGIEGQREYFRLKVVLLVPDSCVKIPAEELDDFEGLYSDDVEIPTGIIALKNTLEPFFDAPFTSELTREVEKKISQFYYENGDPFVIVSVLRKELKRGILQILVKRAVIEKINFANSNEKVYKKLKRCLDLKQGDPVDLSSLDRSLYRMNQSPFRRVDLIFSQGNKPASTDLTFRVDRMPPYRIYTGFNNEGVATTQRQRWLVGGTYGDLWDIDHVISFQYMASYQLRDFQAFTGQYQAPLPNGDQINLYGGYSSLEARLPFPNRNNKGKSYQASLRYTIPMNIYQGQESEMYCGFDFKATNNTLEFSEIFPNFSKIVNLTQFILGSRYQLERQSFSIQFNPEINISPGKWFPHQSDSDYQSLRPGAKNTWFVFKASYSYTQQLFSGFSSYLYAVGQISTTALLPSEQIGLGGFNTVRGYTERQLNYDTGLLTTFEFRSPSFPVISRIFSRRVYDGISFLFFNDFGFGTNVKRMPGEPITEYIWGIGPGIRYKMPPYIIARFDWGIKLHQKSFFIGGGSMLYFDVIFSY